MRLGLFLAIALVSWLALASGRGWGSLPAILSLVTAAAAGGYLYRSATLRWRPQALLRLVGYFLVHSLSGGFDVARRALGWRVRLDPALVEFETRLQSEGSRVLLANLLSLQPGTLCCRLEGMRLSVHVLDQRQPVQESMRRLEARIGDAFD